MHALLLEVAEETQYYQDDKRSTLGWLTLAVKTLGSALKFLDKSTTQGVRQELIKLAAIAVTCVDKRFAFKD